MHNASSAEDQNHQRYVTMKRYPNPFSTASMARSIYKEIELLRYLKHGNLANLVDIFVAPSEQICITTESMELDLELLLRTRPIQAEFVQFFFYQIMRGLKYIHSAGVVHCDLKPSNILVNRNCDLKIRNVACTKAQETGIGGDFFNQYYRAPEAIFSRQTYNKYMDIWSAGCILAELLQRKILFPGQNSIHQLYLITQMLGTPSQIAMDRVAVGDAFDIARSLHTARDRSLSDIMPHIDLRAISFLEKLLVFDPRGRVTASEALTSAYLAPYHDPNDEPVAERRLALTLGRYDDTIDVWMAKLKAAILDYREQAELQQVVQRWLLDVGS